MATHDFEEHYGGRCETLGQFARVYAGMGYAVLPLQRGGKRPHRTLGDRGGVHWASARPDVVRMYWDSAPHANIGVACGQASGGLVVLDLDRKNGNDGPAALLTELHSLGLAVPDGVPYVATPSGGVHLWMRWPGGQAPPPERPGLLQGVDVKGQGGLVAAAPSGLSKARLEAGQESVERIVPYSWQSGCPCEVPLMPEGMALWISTAPSKGSQAGGFGDAPLADVAAEQAAAELAPGGRNSGMSRRAASLFRALGTDDAGLRKVTVDLRNVWERMDNTGFPWSEVTTIIAHARQFVARQEARDREAERMAQPWLDKYRRRA